MNGRLHMGLSIEVISSERLLCTIPLSAHPRPPTLPCISSLQSHSLTFPNHHLSLPTRLVYSLLLPLQHQILFSVTVYFLQTAVIPPNSGNSSNQLDRLSRLLQLSESSGNQDATKHGCEKKGSKGVVKASQGPYR